MRAPPPASQSAGKRHTQLHRQRTSIFILPCRAAHKRTGVQLASGHDPQVGTVSLRFAQPLPLEGLKRWLDRLLWEKVAVMDIYRLKGLLSIEGSDRKHVVQVRCVCSLHDAVARSTSGTIGCGCPSGCAQLSPYCCVTSWEHERHRMCKNSRWALVITATKCTRSSCVLQNSGQAVLVASAGGA